MTKDLLLLAQLSANPNVSFYQTQKANSLMWEPHPIPTGHLNHLIPMWGDLMSGCDEGNWTPCAPAHTMESFQVQDLEWRRQISKSSAKVKSCSHVTSSRSAVNPAASHEEQWDSKYKASISLTVLHGNNSFQPVLLIGNHLMPASQCLHFCYLNLWLSGFFFRWNETGQAWQNNRVNSRYGWCVQLANMLPTLSMDKTHYPATKG